MAKPKSNQNRGFIDKINYELSHMTLRDMKRNAVIRGLEFESVITYDVCKFQSWLYRHWENDISTKLLDRFDEWFENKLREGGAEESLIHPMLRLGYIAETDEDGNTTKSKRIKGMRKEKERSKKTKNEFGIFSGTKKASTFELQKQGYKVQDVITILCEQYGESDVSVKSVQIWYNKAKKLNGDVAINNPKVYDKKPKNKTIIHTVEATRIAMLWAKS